MGFYCEKVYKKHVDSYGEFGAGNIWENIRPTFNMALEQYKSFKVRMKTGFFWYYLEENQKSPIIEEEKDYQ